jgi:twitching motility protein PilT
MDHVKGTMHQLLKLMVSQGASDLHISTNSPPELRIDGELVPLKSEPLSPAQTRALCMSLLTDEQRRKFESDNELDFSFGIEDVARFRGNVFVQRGSVAGAFRYIPNRIRTFEELCLPPVLKEMSELPRGLVLITGPTGSGKSTTLATLIDHINRSFKKHIITIEDPIEYVHSNRQSLVNQREIGSDTESYHSAVRYLLRQDPDVVLLGELRDKESIETALVLAETGHLVLSTLHTNSCAQTINRIIDVFPAGQQDQIRTQLSFVLEGVVCQQLLVKAGGRGRTIALEIMRATAGIRNLIREDKIHMIYSTIQLNRTKSSMQTMNQALADLCLKKVITVDEALSHTSDMVELKQMLGLNHNN